MESIKESGKEGIKVAGGLPPLGPTFNSDMVPEDKILERDYELIASTLAPYSDIFLCETMSSIREALGACRVADKYDKPIWCSFALGESSECLLRSGEFLKDAIEALGEIKNLEAILVNCSSTDSILISMPVMRKAAKATVKVGAYANNFPPKTNVKQNPALPVQCFKDEYRKELTPQNYARIASNWLDAGATIIGGCCGIFPEHIEELKSF